MADSRDVYLTLDLALRIGDQLMSAGAGAADVSATMLAVTRACGLRNCEVDVTFTRLSLSYHISVDEPSQTLMRQVKYRETDYGDLIGVEELVEDLLAREIDRDQARTRLASLVSSGHRYSRAAVTVGWGFMGMGVSLVIGGGWILTLLAFCSCAGIDLLQRWLESLRLPFFYRQLAGGLLATMVALGAAALNLPLDPSLVVTAVIILLLAGVAFMGAVQDALTGFYLTSGARMLEAVLATAGIIAGVSGGLALAHRAGIAMAFTPGTYGWADSTTMLFGAALTGGAFAYASYAPLRSLVPIAVIAALGEACFLALLFQNLGRPFASAAAATVIGLVSYTVAGRMRVPPLVVVVCGVVPMLPGLSIYRGLSLIAERDTRGFVAFATAAAIALALAAGVILGEYIAQPLKREARKIEGRLSGPRLVGPLRARVASHRPVRPRERD